MLDLMFSRFHILSCEVTTIALNSALGSLILSLSCMATVKRYKSAKMNVMYISWGMLIPLPPNGVNASDVMQ